MNRRSFFIAFGSLPFLGSLIPTEAKPTPVHFEKAPWFMLQDYIKTLPEFPQRLIAMVSLTYAPRYYKTWSSDDAGLLEEFDTWFNAELKYGKYDGKFLIVRSVVDEFQDNNQEWKRIRETYFSDSALSRWRIQNMMSEVRRIEEEDQVLMEKYQKLDREVRGIV